MAKLSTRQRGKKNPTWYYSFDAGIMPDGKRKRVEKGGFATEKEARNAGTKAMASFLKGNIAIISEKITVRDFLAEWLERKKLEVRPGTLENYRSLANIIDPVIGSKCLQKLRPIDIDKMMFQLAGNGLSYGYLTRLLNTLKSAFSYAVYPAELIQANPAQYIKVPRNAPRNVVKRHIVRGEKLKDILDAFPFGHACHMPFMISYHTGMRIGEVLGLCWDCVDMEKGVISVVRQIRSVSGTGNTFALPKTASSVRDIPIGDELLSLLRRWKAQQAVSEMKRGRAYIYAYEDKNGLMWQMQKQAKPDKGMVLRPLVCTRNSGKVVSRATFMQALERVGINSHSLRHTHATICAESGAPPKGLAGRLGHKNTSITENLYTHETETMKEAALDAFERAIKKSVL